MRKRLVLSSVCLAAVGGCSSAVRLQASPASLDELAEAPRIVASSDAFERPIAVRLESDAGTTLRYTLDGSEPTITSARYDGLIRIDDTCVMRVRAFDDGIVVSRPAQMAFRRIEPAEAGSDALPGDSSDD